VNFPFTARQVAAVLVAVFVLTTIWAAYSLYTEGRGTTATTPTPVATYSQEALNSFVADIAPSYLYNNSTEISGGNTTLFTPITNWINASLTYSLQTNRTANISLVESIAVMLSTPVWSKTLFTTFNNSSLVATTFATAEFRYAVNVSTIVALAQAIDTQLNYYGSEYTLSLDSVISGSVEAAGVEQPFALQPEMNFTFAGTLITPSGLKYASSGLLVAPAPSISGDDPSGIVPLLGLVGSVAGLCASGWVVMRRADRGRQPPPLDQLIKPYEEAIAVIAQAPREVSETPVATFTDLVKIADTLGKPILRPAGLGMAHRTFFVLDGDVAYSYQHPLEGAEFAPPTSGSNMPPTAERSPTRSTLVRELQRQVKRLDSLALDATAAAEARRRVRRAVDLIHAGRAREAAEEIKELSRYAAASPLPPRELH
jgi:Family of unknown function (DUF5305)